MPQNTRTDDSEGYLAVFGNIVIPRAFCSVCRRESLVQDGKMLCCGKVAGNISDRFKVEVEKAFEKRRQLTKAKKKDILNEQNFSCFYCRRRFGSLAKRGKKLIRLRINWDHIVPYSYSFNNSAENFVAACHICNSLKSDYVFNSLEEAQVFLELRRAEKGYADLLKLPTTDESDPPREEVLHGEVPDSKLRDNSEPAIERSLLDKRSCSKIGHKFINRPKKNKKGRNQSPSHRKSIVDPSKPVKLIPPETAQGFLDFSVRYSLSRRQLSEVCLVLSKSSAQRLIRGTMTTTYFASIKIDLVKNIEGFLTERQKSQAEIAEEIKLLFKPLAINDEQTIIVEKGSLVRFVFKDHTGNTLKISEIQG